MTVDIQDYNMVTVGRSTDLDVNSTKSDVSQNLRVDATPEPVVEKWVVWKRVTLLIFSATALWGLLIWGGIWLFS